MRCVQCLKFSAIPLFLLLCGCGDRTLSPSALSYATLKANYTKGTPIPDNNPTNTGGAITSYYVSPALPAGLNFNTSTGVVSGTPTAGSTKTSYRVTAANYAGSTAASLSIAVMAPLSAADINLIFVVSGDLSYNAAGDVDPTTANLTSQGLQRSLHMAAYLQQQVLGSKNVTRIYTLEPMTHLQTANDYPDMAAIESMQQFAMLNQITLPTGIAGGARFTGNSYPLITGYASGVPLPAEVAQPLVPCQPSTCQGLDFNDEGGDNEALAAAIVHARAPGFYVFSAPWETTSKLLASIDNREGYNFSLPASYAGPNEIYAISITPAGSAALSLFDSNLKPPSTYPALPSPPLSLGNTCAGQTPFQILVSPGVDGAVLPAGTNTDQTLYMVRHAEAHPVGAWEDGNFVAAGQWRALALPNALRGKISPDQVWSIDPAQSFNQGELFVSYVRPSLTVEPYAIANNLPFYLAASFEIGAQNAPQLATEASSFFFNGGKFSNRKALMAWEHEHIPTTLNALIASYFPNGGGQPPANLTVPNWPDSDYDTVWTVTIDSSGNVSVDNAICEGIDSMALPATAPQF